jgi:hypothetical protein
MLAGPSVGGRSTVGHVALDHVIGVRIPASQPVLLIEQRFTQCRSRIPANQLTIPFDHFNFRSLLSSVSSISPRSDSPGRIDNIGVMMEGVDSLGFVH